MAHNPYAPGAHFDPRFANVKVPDRTPHQPPSLPQPEPHPWPGQNAFGPSGPDWRAYRDLYRELALIYAGVTLPSEFVLKPFRYNKQSEIVTRANGDIVSLDAATPTRTLRFEFPEYAFAQRLTARVRGVRLTAAGQGEAGYFADTNPNDYIQVELSYAQKSDLFLSGPTPLSEVAGLNTSLGGAYFFSALPWIPRGTVITATVSILEPTFGGGFPPFVASVAGVSLTWDTLTIPRLQVV